VRTAEWAHLPVDQIRHAQIRDWRDKLPTLTWKYEHKRRRTGEVTSVTTGRYGPRSLVVWLATARVIWKEAVVRYELPRNPMDGIRNYSRKTARTYTKEQPNSLNPRTEVPKFMALLKVMYPRWYAFVLLGIVTGQRPSTLRPIRRRGPKADIDFVNKKLYIRRSNPFKQEIMETTKTGIDIELSLPDELVEVLKEQAARVDASKVGPKTDLLFPSPWSGKLLTSGCLRNAFRGVMKAMGLGHRNLTPRMMRRTYQDIADEAKLRGATAMAVSGHKSVGMKLHYSSVHDDEVREGLSRVIAVATNGSQSSGRTGS
jgi:integrase